MFNNKAQTELIPMALMLFISIAFIYTLALVIPPVFTVIEQLDNAADHTGSLYQDVPAIFEQSTNLWFFMLIMGVAISIIHMALVAIRRQRYTGVQNESDF